MSEPTSNDMTFDTVANRLTALRVIMVPLVVWCLFEDTPTRNLMAAIFFGIAGLTDYFDGYFARQHQNVTVMGKLMDPLADKFLVVSSLIMLQQQGRLHPVVVILLICRELAITGLRALASAEGIIIPASRMAKWKTATQMAGIPMLILKDSLWGIPLLGLGTFLIYLSLLISLWSLKDYIVDFFKHMADKRRLKKQERRMRRETKHLAKQAAKLRKHMRDEK